MSFKTFVSNIIHKIAHAFVAVFGSQAASDFAKSAEALLATEFGKIVQAIIQAQMSLAATNPTQAHANAFAAIGKAALEAGITLADSLKNLLIELAVTKAKGTLAELTNQIPSSPIQS